MPISLSNPPSSIVDYSILSSKFNNRCKIVFDAFFGSAEDTQIWTVAESGGGTSDIVNGQLKIVTGATASAYGRVTSKGSWRSADYTKLIMQFNILDSRVQDAGFDYAGDSACGFINGEHYAGIARDFTDNTKWTLITKDGATIQRSTAFSMDATTKKHILIEVSSTYVKLYVDGTLTATNTTNIPASTTALTARLVGANASSNQSTFTRIFDNCIVGAVE